MILSADLNYGDHVMRVNNDLLVANAVNFIDPQDIQLHLGSEPRFEFYPPITFVDEHEQPHGTFATGVFFSQTSKMACPSWSLPAGPDKFGGSCLFATPSQRVEEFLREHLSVPVCRGCYTKNGRYRYLNNQVARHIHLVWLRGQLKHHGAFAFAFRCAFRRIGQADYFRVHDSGDVLWGGRAYAEEWKIIADEHPFTRFWMPTHDWHSPKLIKWFADRPSNLVIRPSAEGFEMPAPSVPGLDGGTAVSGDRFDTKQYGTWDCPAYRFGGSCVSAHCRHCWTQPDLTIVYSAHGPGSPIARHIREMRADWRKNPYDLDLAAGLYAAGYWLDDIAEMLG